MSVVRHEGQHQSQHQSQSQHQQAALNEAHHGAHHGEASGHGSRRGYLIGFLLSVVLTAVPFGLVMSGALASPVLTALVIFACAGVQIVVHVVYFLHLDTRGEGGWTLISFVFTVVIVAIVLGGSLWIMYHLNTNMMPMQPGVANAP